MSDDATLDEFADSGKTGTNQEVPPPTELTGVTDDWANVRLAKVAKSDDGAFVDGPFGSNLKADEMHTEGYARVIQLQNIRESEFVDTNHRYISEEKFEELSRHGAEAGDLAIAKMSEPVARACLLPDIEDQYLVVADCIKLSVDESAHNSQFVMLALNSRSVWKQAFARSRGSTRKRINLTQLKEVQIPSPPLSEQRKIATVLHTVDQAIQKTEEIIEQTKRVKTGVSQHYFEDYNTIRREENPKSVEMVELSNLVDFKPGKAWKTDNLSEEGLKVVRISNLTGQKDEYWRYNSDYEERRVIENGDLLFSWAGMKSSIGVHIYRGEKALLNQHIYNLEPKTSIGRKYLYYYLDYRMSDLYSLSQGGAVQVHLTKDIIERILIPKVPAEKQESMVAHLSEIDNALQNEIARKNRLKRLKRGLMQDLLSGEVRTTDVDIDIPEEVAKYG